LPLSWIVCAGMLIVRLVPSSLVTVALKSTSVE
jgi:hypothetical protein